MFNYFPLPVREDLRIFWGLQSPLKGMLNILLPVTEQPQGRDFCNRNLKRAERVARSLVGAREREEQTRKLILGMGKGVFLRLLQEGIPQQLFIAISDLKRHGEIQHRGRRVFLSTISPCPISSLDEETN